MLVSQTCVESQRPPTSTLILFWQNTQLAAQVEPLGFEPTEVGGILHPQETPLENMESLGGLGGSLGSNNSNHDNDNRVSTMNGGLLHAWLDER